MSDVLTHGYCAYNAISSLEYPNIKRIINEHISFYYLGAQGPDIFFYYNVWPWADGKSVNNLASILHKHNTQLFLIESYHYIHSISSIKDREIMLAYFYGFLSHYALDQISHPFIFYYSGVTDPKDNSTSLFKYEHKLFECSLDTILRNNYSASNEHLKTQHDIVKLTEAIPLAFDTFFQYIFKKVYDVDIVDSCASIAAKSMYKVIKFLYDPRHMKKHVLVIFEKLINKPLAYSTAVFPVSLDNRLDYMNTSKKQWLHPCDDTIKSTHSFMELFEKATKLTAEYINAFENYTQGSLSDVSLKSIIQNNAYDTGQPSDKRIPMKHYASIYHPQQ